MGKILGNREKYVISCYRFAMRAIVAAVLFVFGAQSLFAQLKYEGKPIAQIKITLEGNDHDESAVEQFRLIATDAIGESYSTVNIRNALAQLFDTKRIVSANVEVEEEVAGKLFLNINIRRKMVARKLTINLINSAQSGIKEEELLLRLNLFNPGDAVTQADLDDGSNYIMAYLRDRGYYESKAKHREVPLDSDRDVEVIYDVTPGNPTLVSKFNIDIANFDDLEVSKEVKLKPGAPYSQDALRTDVSTIRGSLGKAGYLAPQLDEPQLVYDSDKNEMEITQRGSAGAKVNVVIDSEKEKINEKTERELLPILREGTIDFAAIVEGERRLENYYQERGYFFATVTPICSVTPPFKTGEASEIENDSEVLCTSLSGADLTDRKVDIKYEVDLNRRLKLTDIRIEGDTVANEGEAIPLLQSQKASPLGIVPFLGYGRGYTSTDLLQTDRDTLRSLLNELGYANATVGIKQGVSPEGEDLIITFVIDDGIPTKITDAEITGNTVFTDEQLLAQAPKLKGTQFSSAKIKNGQHDIQKFYADNGYYDAVVTVSATYTPAAAGAPEDSSKVTYKVDNEGRQVMINRVLVNGNERTKREAILNWVDVRPGKLLRQVDIFTSEQSLFATDAFDVVEVKPEPAGESADGKYRQVDVIVNVQEKAPRLLTYGGGFSTDLGWSGFFDIRNFNLRGSLYQGGAQVRLSQRQQLVQIDFQNPRFMKDGLDEDGRQIYSPLTFSAQYQKDSTVTRFFRSTFDQGTFGIVQRVDADGNPIDQFGDIVSNPTINRFTLSVETSKTISRKARSILFFKYRFEDVRLQNIDSLLLADLLRPDSKIRISGFSTTYVRDTRENCSNKNTLLNIIQNGEPGDPCKYNSSDPTDGEYITAEYDVSLPFLGANIGFNKLQVSYNRYYTIGKLKKTTLAGRVIVGLANVFSSGNRFTNPQYAPLNQSLPISERFFAGGSTTLRGFEYEGAGPRVVITPQGEFRDQSGKVVVLSPFTVPFGGNAMVITNLEARIPVSESVRIVPFYDGGNVFLGIKDIFSNGNAPTSDYFVSNLRATWTNTVGLGIRVKAPIGGEFAVDYGYLLNPPSFIIPEDPPPNAILRLHQGQFHFRFSQAF